MVQRCYCEMVQTKCHLSESRARVVRRDGSVHNTPEGFLISWVLFSNAADKYKIIGKENGIKVRPECQASYTTYIHAHSWFINCGNNLTVKHNKKKWIKLTYNNYNTKWYYSDRKKWYQSSKHKPLNLLRKHEFKDVIFLLQILFMLAFIKILEIISACNAAFHSII